MTRRGARKSVTRRIQEVRITDPTAGSDGAKIDRIISQLQNSASQTRILAGDVVDVQPPVSTGATRIYGFDSIIATDDFQSLAAQFETYRVTAIKFDVYDINPGSVVQNVWSTFHNDIFDVSPAYTRLQIVDAPDSKVLSSGETHTTFYWRAHGTEEMRFQGTSTVSTRLAYFGGLRFHTLASAQSVNQKYQVIVHAVVDFRGRL